MKTSCPHCGTAYDVPDNYLNQPVECLKCKKDFIAKPSLDFAPRDAEPNASASARGQIAALRDMAAVDDDYVFKITARALYAIAAMSVAFGVFLVAGGALAQFLGAESAGMVFVAGLICLSSGVSVGWMYAMLRCLMRIADSVATSKVAAASTVQK